MYSFATWWPSTVPQLLHILAPLSFIIFWLSRHTSYFAKKAHSDDCTYMSGHKTVQITEPHFYQIVKIERCGTCRSRNLTITFCAGTH